VKKFNAVYSASKGNYRKVSCLGYTTRKELHPLELTSKASTEFAYNGTSRRLYKERYCRIEVISELKCM